MARVNEYRTTDVTRVLKTLSAELSQNACGERTKNILFSSVFSSVILYIVIYSYIFSSVLYIYRERERGQKQRDICLLCNF